MVLIHEFVHIFLRHKGIRKKIPGLNLQELADQCERNDEWITNRVAGAISMPFIEALATRCTRWEDLVKRFPVTPEAARQRIKQIKVMALARPTDVIAPPRGAATASSKFWSMLQDYEAKTNSKLQTLVQARGTPGAKGYLLKICECGGSGCIHDGKGFRCDNCGSYAETQNVVLLEIAPFGQK